MRNT
jgi:hypothetical protein